MPTKSTATLLRIFVGEYAKNKSQPLYEAIVMKAREMNLAGATVLRGPLGFGQSERLHTANLLHLWEELSVVIEIVDTPQKIRDFLPVLDQMMTSGLVTTASVEVLSQSEPAAPAIST